MDSKPGYVSETKRGIARYIFQGYGFVKDKYGPDNIKCWTCNKKDEMSCKGRMRTDGGRIVALVGEHNHAPDATMKEIAKIRDDISAKGQTTLESTHHIVNIALADSSQAAAAQLPETKTLEKQCQRQRARPVNVPPNPGSLQELVFPHQCTVTKGGAGILLHDDGVNGGNQRLVVFSTDENMQLLEDSEQRYTDGTFKTVPWLFHQLYTIAVKRGDHYLPVVYALLPDKRQETYERLLDILKQAKEDLGPSKRVP